MPKINLLEKDIAELIAAGEVVERPASVAKELIENSIDAGARHITVELRRGGISLLRITDDGCGIAREDVPLAFLRHATSKIRTASDLEAITSLGFRGEALAATCAVSRVEMITKPHGEPIGTHYMIEGGTETLYVETGCPDGTTILVNDLFYNTPARMKFMKKDVSEGNAVAAVVDRAALSHPEISFKLIREGKQTLLTAGDGDLSAAVYSVLGRDFARSVIPVSGENGGISVTGLICRPVSCRSSRTLQFTFLNGRFVQSGTVTAAVEQAYKHSVMVGKFPAFVLNVTVPCGAVDVNVHPAKTQVRFSDERRVFEAVYTAVKGALAASDTRPEIKTAASAGRRAQALSPFAHLSSQEYRQQVLATEVSQPAPAQKPPASAPAPKEARLRDTPSLYFDHPDYQAYRQKSVRVDIEREPEETFRPAAPPEPETPPAPTAVPESGASSDAETVAQPPQAVRLIGEAFATYIITEMGDSIFLIDKHAAHERILFEKLRASESVEVQQLLSPVRVTLGKREYDAAVNNTELLSSAGFEIEDFGGSTVLVRSVPAPLIKADVAAIIEEAAAGLAAQGSVELSGLDELFHTIACKAATKGGWHTTPAEMLALAERVLGSRDILYCPHGRPVAFEIKRRELEKQFGRIQ